MTDLVFLAFGIFGFFKGFGILIAIVLIVVWWTKVKNTTALFYDPKKIRATLMYFVPGFILLSLGLFFNFVWSPRYSSGDYSSDSYNYVEPTPTLAELYIANYTDKVGRIEVGDFRDSLDPKTARQINILSEADQDTIRLWVGDSLVLDTIIGKGCWVGNFSDDISVVAEEIVYSANIYANTEDLGYVLITRPEIERFSEYTYEEVYGFSTEAPKTVSVSSSTNRVSKWDVDILTDDELMQLLMDALGKEEGALDDENEDSE